MKSTSLRSALLLSVVWPGSFALAQTATVAVDNTAAPATQVAQASNAGPDGNILKEVVVTAARRRSENVQATPLAITAVSGSMLEKAHVINFNQLGQLAPNLQMYHNLGTGGVSNVYLRGFGQNSNDPAVEPHVAVLIDGVYQAGSVGNLFDMWDTCSVEIQAGPQGTLQGKNASIGAVALNHCKANGNAFEGMIEGDYGSYDHVGGRGWLNLPILHNEAGDSIFAARVAVSYKEGGNWVYDRQTNKNEFGGDNDKSARVALSFTPTPDFDWEVFVSGDQNRQPQIGTEQVNYIKGVPGSNSNATQGAPLAYSLYGADSSPLPYGVSDANFTDRPYSDQAEVSSTINYKFEPVTFTAVTGYESYWQTDNSDDAGTPFPALNAYNDLTSYDFESQEIRIGSNKGGGLDLDGLIDWVVGGFASNFNYKFSNNLGILQAPGTPNRTVNVSQRETGNSQSQAAFAHIVFNFTDQWKGTFGVRQSWDHKDHAYQAPDGFYPNHNSIVTDIPAGFHNTSYEVGTSYQFDPDHLAYFRFAEGYQAGGTAGQGLNDTYQPELNKEYEIGFKADWLEKRLRTNLTFFINELDSLQVESALAIDRAPGFVEETLNAGSATVEGMEAQIIALPIDNLTTHVTFGYLHTKYDKFSGTTCSNTFAPADCSGLPFANAPKFTINVGADYNYDLPGDLGTTTFSASWDYRSTQFTTDPVYPQSEQEGYGLVNAGIKYTDPSDMYTFEAFGTNILDRKYKLAFTDPSAGAPSVGIAGWYEEGRPAEYGLRFTAKFSVAHATPEQPAVAPPPPPPPEAPPAPAAAAPEPARSFQVFFNFDKSDITPDAARVIEQAAETVKSGHAAHIDVVGHTDTVGSLAYNQKLSERRAASVKAEMVHDGVSSGEIGTSGVGKSDLLVPTPDGVREPQNRRAEIHLAAAAGS